MIPVGGIVRLDKLLFSHQNGHLQLNEMQAQRARVSEGRGYNPLSSILFHLHATQGGGEKHVVSPSGVGGLSSALLAVSVYTRSNVRRRVALGCWSHGMSLTRLLEQGRRNCPCRVNRSWTPGADLFCLAAVVSLSTCPQVVQQRSASVVNQSENPRYWNVPLFQSCFCWLNQLM